MDSSEEIDVSEYPSEKVPNIVISGLSVLSWFLFRPSYWRHFVFKIDPSLAVDMCLADLKLLHWQNKKLRSHLMGGYFVIPFLTSFFIALFFISKGLISHNIWIGLLLSIGIGLAIGITVNIPSGILAAFVSSIFFSIYFGLADATILNIFLSNIIGINIGCMTGIIIYATTTIVNQNANSTISQQGRSIFAGFLSGLLLFLLILSSLFLVIISWQNNQIRSVVTGIFTGFIPFTIFGMTVWWQSNKVVPSLIAGSLFGLTLAVIFIIPFQNKGVLPDIYGIDLITIILSIIFTIFIILFTLPYVLVSRIAGSTVGVIIAAVVIMLVIMGIGAIFPIFNWQTNLFWNVLVIIIIATMGLWRPLLFYPFEYLWNTFLYQRDKEEYGENGVRLYRNSAFWDEQQRIPLFGLENHLIWVLERDVEAGQTAVHRLNFTHQRWAARAAQIELDARQFMAQGNIDAIGTVHKSFIGGGIEGPASALLRSFSYISKDIASALNQESSFNQRLALNAINEHLNGVIREITRSNEKYAIRFQPVAKSWHNIILAYISELEDAAERRQEIDNPYIIGVPLTSQQEIFVGRVDISRRIENLIIDKRRPPILLYGQRRMGKTSLLNNLGRMLPFNIIPLFVDLQGPVSFATDHAGLFYNLSRSMVNSAMKQRGIELPLPPRQTLNQDPFTSFDEWLDQVEKVLVQNKKNTILLLLDEFESLDLAFEDGRFDETAVLSFLRHIIQHRNRFKVLMAGSHTLNEFKRWSSYLINAQIIPIGYLSVEEVHHLIEKPINNFALRYHEDARNRVVSVTRGHPFLVQLLCSEIVSLKNTQITDRRRLVTKEDVELAIPEVLNRGGLFFADIEQNQVSSANIDLLKAIATAGEETSVPFSRLSIQTGNKIELNQSLNQLIKRDILEEDDGKYQFQVELIRQWFAQYTV